MADDIHISLYAETLFHIGPIPITNSFLVMVLVMAGLLLFFSWLARKIEVDPSEGGRSGAFGEMIIDFLLNLVESTGGKRLGRQIFPLVSGLFIFIITANFTGLLPGIGSIWVDKEVENGAHAVVAESEKLASTDVSMVAAAAVAAEEGATTVHVPIFRPPTADLNMTLAMSTITFVAVQIFGVRAHGVGGRLKHMATPPFLFPIEVISEFSRIISLAARLFGNVFAGEILLGVAYAIANAVKIAIIPVLFPVIFLGLETLFGTIQALVFSLLTLIYIYLAAAGHGDHADHEDDHAADHDTVRPVEAQAPDSGSRPATAGN
jgi:F-type H+-transporting ATPase subunit a